MQIKNLLVLFLFSCSAVYAQKIVPFPYEISKEATGDTAMVVSAHPLATQVGIDVLKMGGNAVDAAIAVQFALAVVYPQAGNIGGGGFMVYRSKSGVTDALDYREKAPAAAFEKMYQDSAGNVQTFKSRLGSLACGVPGTVDGLWEAHKKYGKLPWGKLLTPAIELAENGYRITEQEAQNLNNERLTFVRNSSIMPAFVRMDNWEAGAWLIQKDLAATLRRIAGDGRAGFYEGATAALILHEMSKKNGIISAADLEAYHSVWRKPLMFYHRGLQIITMPPPSSGGILLRQMLVMGADASLKKAGFHSAGAMHRMAEAGRRAFADRAVHMGDPDFWNVPQTQLMDSAYLLRRMADFKPDTTTASARVTAGNWKESTETTHISIVDAEGNAVSATTTLNDAYGSRCVVSGAGFILNNQMDDFSAKPGVPNQFGAVGGKANAIAGGKRPLSSMTPTIIARDGKTWMVLGTPGGTTIPSSVFQIIVNVYEFGLSLPEAVKAGRFHHQWQPDAIQIEDNVFPEETLQQLRRLGHDILVRPKPFGRVEALIRTPEGRWQGVADPRGDDHAAGY